MLPSRPHPLIAAVRRALPRRRPRDVARYLELLDRRLAALAALAAGEAAVPRRLGATRGDRALARRVLAPLEGRWDDGDESFVRSHLDGWMRDELDSLRAAARALTAAAEALAAVEARPATLWFYLWAMESLLGETRGGRVTPASDADKAGRPC